MTLPGQRLRQNNGLVLYAAAALAAFLFAHTGTSKAQELPKEIRGYKVHKAAVRVEPDTVQGPVNSAETPKPDAVVKIPRPRVVDIGLTGVILEVTALISPPKQRGKVDLLTFHAVNVNGLPLDIEEYTDPFELSGKTDTPVRITVRAFVRNTDILRAAYRELVDSQDKWRVKGRVFVFGRFRKFGFSVKRVVPVDIELEIPNPLR